MPICHASVSALSLVTERVSPEAQRQYSAIPPLVVAFPDDQSQVGNIAYIGKLLHLLNIQCTLNYSELRELSRKFHLCYGAAR